MTVSGGNAVPRWLWAAAIIPRAALMALASADPSRCLRPDSPGYLALAGNLVRFRAFSAGSGPVFSPETFRSPGYPLFLSVFAALFNHPVLAVVSVQCVLGVAAVAIAWRWLSDWTDRRGAAVGATVLALDPVLLFHTPLILADTFYGFLLVIAVVQTWKLLDPGSSGTESKGGFFCGLLWSLAAMVKPISLYLSLPLCWLWRRRAGMLAAFVIAAYLLPGAWILRNWRATGYPIFSSLAGIDLLRYPAAGVESLRTGRPLGQIEIELREAVDRAHPAGYANNAEQSAAYSEAAMPIIKAHPILLARYWVWGMIKVLGGTGAEMSLEWAGAGASETKEMEVRAEASGQGTAHLLKRHPVLIPFQLIYMAALAALYVFALMGLKKLWLSGFKTQAIFLGGCLAYFLVLSGSEGYYRYRIPMVPFLAACAAAGVGRVRSETRTAA